MPKTTVGYVLRILLTGHLSVGSVYLTPFDTKNDGTQEPTAQNTHHS